MTIPLVGLYTDNIPSRSEPLTFRVDGDDFNAYFGVIGVDINATATEMNNTAATIDADKIASAASAVESAGYATDSLGHATDSANSATTAQSLANFKGRWSDATGSATVASSYANDGQTWQLLQDIADITLDEPVAGAANWQIINEINMSNVNVSALDNPLLHAFTKNDLVRVMNGSTVLTSDRNTTATSVDVSGIVRTALADDPREELSGWLFEGASENLALYSEEFDNVAWTKVSVTITPNVGVSPDGTTTADRYLGVAGAHNMTDSVTYVGTTATISLWVKSNGGGLDTFRLVLDGAVVSADLTATNEWQRFSFTSEALTAGSNVIGVNRDSSNNATDILIWGLQVEESPIATSYIKTEATTVTRSADNISFPTQGSFRESEGCIFLKADVIGDMGTDQYLLDISDGTANNRLSIVRSADKTRLLIVTGGVTQSDISTVSDMTVNQQYKITVNHKDNDVELFVDGLSVGTDIVATMPGGLSVTNSGKSLTIDDLQGHIQDLRFYDRNLTIDEIKYLGGL